MPFRRSKAWFAPVLVVLLLVGGGAAIFRIQPHPPPRSASDRLSIGTVRPRAGSIDVQGPGEEWRSVAEGDDVELFEGDRIRTADSGCRLVLGDGNEVRVAPGTVLVLERLVQNADGSTETTLSLARGSIESSFAADRSRELSIRTPVSTIIVRPRTLVFPEIDARLPRNDRERAILAWKVAHFGLEALRAEPGIDPVAVERAGAEYAEGRAALHEERDAEALARFEACWAELESAFRQRAGETRLAITVGEEADRIEVLEGRADVVSSTLTRQLETGEGIEIGRGRPADEPVRLLDAPAPISPVDDTVYNRPRVDLQWAAGEGVARYRIEVARGPGFEAEDLLAVFESEGPTAAGVELADGEYYWRVRSIDAQGLGGPPTAPLPFRKATDHEAPTVRWTGRSEWGG